ncbi:MAG: helix-turn-helix domain-containing protein [Actinobacteria bacterium]|nr:helix-turn-helix domain-containing protein [Actinomycetota bacterium]
MSGLERAHGADRPTGRGSVPRTPVVSGRTVVRAQSVVEAATQAYLEDAEDGSRTPVPVEVLHFLRLLVPDQPSGGGGTRGVDRAAARRLRRAASDLGDHAATLRVGDVVRRLARRDVQVLVQLADVVVRATERLGADVAGGALADVARAASREHRERPDEELTSNEAAALLAVSRPHVVKLAKTGALPYRMVGTHHRFKRSDVERYEVVQAARRDALLASVMVDEYLPGDF